MIAVRSTSQAWLPMSSCSTSQTAKASLTSAGWSIPACVRIDKTRNCRLPTTRLTTKNQTHPWLSNTSSGSRKIWPRRRICVSHAEVGATLCSGASLARSDIVLRPPFHAPSAVKSTVWASPRKYRKCVRQSRLGTDDEHYMLKIRLPGVIH